MTDNQEKNTHTESLKKWSPSLFLKIGVGLSITFCAILSILIATLVITIPAIIMLSILLIPRVDTKKYHAYWKFIPVVLVIMLTAIIGAVVFFATVGLEQVANTIVDFTDKYIIFWTKNDKLADVDITFWLGTFEIILFSIGCAGPVFIILGWYKGKEIGKVEVENKTKRKKKIKSTKQTNVKKVEVVEEPKTEEDVKK